MASEPSSEGSSAKRKRNGIVTDHFADEDEDNIVVAVGRKDRSEPLWSSGAPASKKFKSSESPDAPASTEPDPQRGTAIQVQARARGKRDKQIQERRVNAAKGSVFPDNIETDGAVGPRLEAGQEEIDHADHDDTNEPGAPIPEADIELTKHRDEALLQTTPPAEGTHAEDAIQMESESSTREENNDTEQSIVFVQDHLPDAARDLTTLPSEPTPESTPVSEDVVPALESAADGSHLHTQEFSPQHAGHDEKELYLPTPPSDDISQSSQSAIPDSADATQELEYAAETAPEDHSPSDGDRSDITLVQDDQGVQAADRSGADTPVDEHLEGDTLLPSDSPNRPAEKAVGLLPQKSKLSSGHGKGSPLKELTMFRKNALIRRQDLVVGLHDDWCEIARCLHGHRLGTPDGLDALERVLAKAQPVFEELEWIYHYHSESGIMSWNSAVLGWILKALDAMDTTDAIAGCMDEIKSIVRVLETWRQLEPQERIWVSKRKPAELPPLDPGLQDHRSAESVIATFVVDYLRRADMIEVLAWFWNQIRVELKGVILANNRDKFLNIFYNNILEPSLTVFEALTTVGGKVCPLYQQEARNLPWDTAALISIHKRVRKRVPREEDAIRVCRGIQKIVTVLRTEPQVDPSECQSETSVPTNVESGLGIRQDERFDWRCLEIKQLWSANVGFLRDIVDEKQSIAGLDDEKTEQLSQFITMLHDLIGPLHEIIRDIDSHEEIDREISKAQEERNQIWLDITAFREELMSLQAQERPTEDCETALKAMMTTLEDANHKVALSRPRNMKRRLLLEATAVDVKMLSGVLFAMTLMPNSIVTNPLRRIIHTLCYTDPPEPFEIADHHLRTEAFRIVDVCADLQAEVQDPFPSDIRKTLLDKLKDLYTGLWSSSDRASVRLLICEAPLEEIQEAAHEVKMRYNALVKAQNNSKLMLAYGVLLQDLDHRADVLRNISEESSEDDDSDDEQKDIAECEERIVKRPVEFNRNLDFDAPENILTDEERERKEFLLLTGETSVVEIQKMTTVLERYIRQYHSKESGRDPVRKQRYKYMAYKLARHLNSYISTNLAKCKDIIWKHVNWQHARSVADRFVKDDLHMVQGFKEKLCIKVNTPQGCKFGKRCYFSHRAEGKMCREPEGKCPRTDCAYVHGEAPILFKHSSAAEVGKEYPDEDEVPQAMAADHMPQDTPKAPVQHRTPQHNRNAPVQKQTPRNNMDTPVQDQTPQHNLDTPAQDQTQVQMQALMALAMKIPMMLPPSNSNFGMPQNIAQQPYSGAGGHFPPHRTQHFQNQQVGPGPMRFNTMQPGYVQDGNGYVHYQQGPFAQNNGFMSAQVPGQRASQIHFKNQFNGHNGFQQDNNGYDHYQQEPLVQNNGFMGAQVPGQRASQIHVENQFSGGHNGFQQGNGMGGQHGYGNGHNSHNNQNSRGGGGGGGSRGNKSRYKGRSKWKHAAFQDDDIGPKARPQSAPKHLRNNGSRKRAHGQDSEDQPDSAREPKRRCRGEDSD